jgi:Pvc16 N-terminal domain
MSQPSAIAAVAATLRNMLATGVTPDPDLNDTTVTTQPPDRARAAGNNANQLNIFLYQALPNAAWRNMDLPGRVNPGETAMPPLALTLHFLITAYGRDNDLVQPFSLQLIGKAMNVLHDHAVLLAKEIKDALPGNDLYAQLERVRLTLQPLSTEEIYRLWSGFQTPYRTSVAYEASVVLIESTRRVKAALPVLTRGQDDTGFPPQADLVPPFPEVTGIDLPNGQTSAQLGDEVIFKGHNFSGDIQVLFKNLRLPDPIRVVPKPGGVSDSIAALIDNAPAKWLPGLYTVALEITENKGTPKEKLRVTNEVPLALAPAIITATFPIKVTIAGGKATVPITCSPQVLPEQHVALLLGDREVTAEVIKGQTGKLKFIVANPEPGSYLVRLRVDGVDSQLVDRSKPIPVFKDQRVVIA